MIYGCARGETDITTVFGTVIGGSNPSGRTDFWIFYLKEDILIPQFLTSTVHYGSLCGYRLVVGRVLAKDEVGVRFSLPAPEDRAYLPE